MALGFISMSPKLVLYSDWSSRIVVDDLVFESDWPAFLIAVSIETPCSHFDKKRKKAGISCDSDFLVFLLGRWI